MVKITVQVQGMACGMCEAHINDALRAAFRIKKVSSSHRKGMTEIVAETELDLAKVKATIEQAGYDVTDMQSAPYEKKGFSLFKR